MDLGRAAVSDIPLQIRMPPTLHLSALREEACLGLVSVRRSTLRIQAITGGRTGSGAPHVEPSVRPSIYFRPLPCYFAALRAAGRTGSGAPHVESSVRPPICSQSAPSFQSPRARELWITNKYLAWQDSVRYTMAAGGHMPATSPAYTWARKKGAVRQSFTAWALPSGPRPPYLRERGRYRGLKR